MGFNTWNHFKCAINETLIVDTARAMVDSGLRDAGYRYLNLDDCWLLKDRNASGFVVPDPDRFPSGMSWLVQTVGKLGLKLGLYMDSGLHTCAGRAGSYGFEKEDAAVLAEWGVQYLKYDNCDIAPNVTVVDRYSRMEAALNATGKPILFSLCSWGDGDPWLHPTLGNTWRTTLDIEDRYGSMLFNLLSTAQLAKYAGPGGWNDPDMLEVGNGGMSQAAYESHFALWAAMKAPLIVGTDVRNMSAATSSILLNSELIAINQDPLGVSAGWVGDTSTASRVMAGPLADGSSVAILFNANADAANAAPLNITLHFADLGYTADTTATVRDLYARENLGNFVGSFSSPVPPEGCRALRIITVVKPQASISSLRATATS